MSKKKEIILGVVILFLLVGFLVFKIFIGNLDRDKYLDEIKVGINTGDIKGVKSYIKTTDGKEITDVELDRVIKELKEVDLSSVPVYDDTKYQEIDEKEPMFFKVEGKRNLFFNNYILYLNKYNLIFNIDIDEFKLFLNDKEVVKPLKIDENYYAIEGLNTGVYKYKCQFGDGFKEVVDGEVVINKDGISNFGDFDKKKLKNKNYNNVVEFIDSNADYIYISTNVNSADGDVYLYVNDKNTNKIIGDGIDYGPLFVRDNYFIQAVVNFDGEEYRSDKINIFLDDGDDYYLEIKYEEDLSEQSIKNAVGDYIVSLVRSINYGSWYMDNVIAPGSPLEKKQVKLIDNLYAKGITENLIEYNIISVERVSRGKYKVRTNEKHYIYNENDVKTVTNNWEYDVHAIDGKPFLYEINDIKK